MSASTFVLVTGASGTIGQPLVAMLASMPSIDGIVALRHVAAVSASHPVFERLREFYDLPELVFQSGVPSDLDLAMFTLGPAGALSVVDYSRELIEHPVWTASENHHHSGYLYRGRDRGRLYRV